MMRSVGRLALLVVFAAGSLAGQKQRPNPQPGDSGQMSRQQLEQQVRRRLAAQMKQNLGLTDAQMQRLQQTNRNFQEKQRLLNEQERDVRMSLRDEIFGGDSTHQAQVSGLMDRLVKVQRQRVDLLEQEQKDLGAFLTPLQRAKYWGAEDRIRQQIQNLRQQQGGGRGPGFQQAPPGGPPGQDPRCDQLDAQKRQQLITRRNRGNPIPPQFEACLPPKQPPSTD